MDKPYKKFLFFFLIVLFLQLTIIILLLWQNVEGAQLRKKSKLLCVSPAQPLTYSPLVGQGENLKVKTGQSQRLRQTVSYIKQKLHVQAKRKQGISSQLPMDRQVFSHVQKNMAPLHVTVLGKTNTLALNFHPFLLLSQLI